MCPVRNDMDRNLKSYCGAVRFATGHIDTTSSHEANCMLRFDIFMADILLKQLAPCDALSLHVQQRHSEMSSLSHHVPSSFSSSSLSSSSSPDIQRIS